MTGAAFSLPLGEVVEADGVELVAAGGPHPYESRNLDAIERNWALETARNPALFDGRIFLFSRLDFAGRRLEGCCHASRFATYMHWRGGGDRQDLRHAFAAAVMVTSDNALVAIEMAAHTVAAGKVYFPSGSFEPDDAVDGRLDVVANMRREVLEETGIDLSGVPREPGFRVLPLDVGTAITTRFQLDLDAREVEARIVAHIAGEDQPEIARPVLIRSAALSGLGVPPHVPPLAARHFARPIDRDTLIRE